MSPEVWDWLRWVNAGLASLAGILLIRETVEFWERMPQELKRTRPPMICVCLIIAYGSGELASSDTFVDPGLRVVGMMATLLWLSVALVANYRSHLHRNR